MTTEDRLWGQLVCDTLDHGHGYGAGWCCSAAGVAALALVAAGCTSSSSVASGKTPVKGGTAVMAEPPSSPPNYIFPFMTAALSSNVNLFDFTYLMYRPLYWFGQGSQPVFNPSLSLASAPVFNGRNVTITLKHYMWSNGTPVTAQDVMFWINMMTGRYRRTGSTSVRETSRRTFRTSRRSARPS